MRTKILKVLACPRCGTEFTLKAGVYRNKEVKEGILRCKNNHEYVIKNFIPRFLLPFNRSIKSKKQVQKSFTSKWSAWQQFSPWFIKFFDEWFQRKLGIKDKRSFKSYFKNKKYLLDVGTGLGTKVETMAKLTTGEVFGVDINDSVSIAYQNTKKYSNTHIIQADLFHLPFKKNLFDFIVSDGVLHHTPTPKKGFLSLCKNLASRGEVSIHVYKKMGPIREFTDDFIRQFSTKLSFQECYDFCKAFTSLGKSLSNLTIKIPQDIPVLEFKKGTYDLQRFIYYNIFQCFWNESISFKENNLVNLDWFHPANASRHTKEEVIKWFKQARLKNVNFFNSNESGISVKGVKT